MRKSIQLKQTLLSVSCSLLGRYLRDALHGRPSTGKLDGRHRRRRPADTRGVLDSIPCTDVSTDDPTFVAFLDNTAKAAKMMPLDEETRALREVAILRKHGCAYLSDPDLWHDMSSIEAMIRDIKNKSLAKSPYFLGRSLCVRNAGTMTKPLSLFCPQACGCHRGDQDCPLSCPERTAPDPPCPAYQKATYWLDNSTCPRLPAAQTFDVGVVSDIAGVATG